MQKLSHNDLINLLEFFSKGRQEIVAPFTMKDYEWRELTFKYERNQEAFNIVRARHFAMWLDSQFIALQKVEVSDKAKEKAVRLLGSMLDSKVSDIDSSLLKHHLLIKKGFRYCGIIKLLNGEEIAKGLSAHGRRRRYILVYRGPSPPCGKVQVILPIGHLI